MHRFLLFTFGLFAACDVAPRAINYEESRIETADEGYQVFIDGALASAMANSLVEGCPAYMFDKEAEQQYRAFFAAEFDRLLVDDPDVARAILQRFGVNLPVDRPATQSFDDLIAPEFDVAYWVANAGLTFDIGTRAVGSVVRQGLDPNCEDAEREIAQGTLAGQFLKPSL